MKKTGKIFNSLKTAIHLCGGGGGLALIALTACSNFLKSGDIAQDIKGAIEYNNAPSYTILLKSDARYGEFLSANEKSVKVGYDIEVEFSANIDDFLFVNLEAVSKTDTSVRRDDCIKFTDVDRDEKRGLYKIKITLLKAQNDIQIQPVCLEYPAITSVSPAGKDANMANTPVTVAFNMPMEDSVTSNISISGAGLSMKDFFEDPELNEEKNVLTIIPKGYDLMEYMKNENRAYIDIDFRFTDGISVTKDETVLPLKENKYTSFTVRYKPEVETVKPLKFDFFATRNNMTLEEAKAYTRTNKNTFYLEEYQLTTEIFVTDEEAEGLDEEHILQNRTTDSIYIYGKYYDQDSGVKTVVVTEQLIYDQGYCEEADEEVYEHTFTSKSKGAEFLSDGTGYTYFFIKVPLESEDGAVQITVTVKDASENKSATESFTVIKNEEPYIYPYLYNQPIEAYSSTFNLTEYLKNKNTLRLYPLTEEEREWHITCDCDTSGLFDIIYGYIYQTCENYKFYCKYKHKNGEIKQEEMPFDKQENCWKLDLDVDSIADLEIELTIISDIGGIYNDIYSFPKRPMIESISSDGKIYFGDYYKTSIQFTIIKSKDGNSTVYPYANNSTNGTNKISYDADYEYQIIPRMNYLYGEVETLTNTAIPQIAGPAIKAVSIVPDTDPERTLDYLYYTITLKEGAWDNFEKIFVEFTATGYNGTYNSYDYFDPGELSITVGYNTIHLFTKDITLKVYGTNGLYRSQPTEYFIAKTSEPKYDNIRPKITIQENPNYEYKTIEFSDNESGPKEAKITFGNNEYKLNQSNNYTVNIPYTVIKEYSSGYNDNGGITIYYNYEGSDNANNTISGTNFLVISRFPQFTKFVKTSSSTGSTNTWKLYTDETKLSVSESTLDYIGYFDIYTLDDNGTSWTRYGTETIQQNPGIRRSGSSSHYTYNTDPLTLPDNSFIKLVYSYKDAWSLYYMDPVYFYTDTTKSTILADEASIANDYILANGSSKTSVILHGDDKAYVEIVKTSKPYDECMTWTAEDWQNFHTTYGGKLIMFKTIVTDQEGNPVVQMNEYQKYIIPSEILNQIEPSECYVVLAHYEDGHAEVSGVMVK